MNNNKARSNSKSLDAEWHETHDEHGNKKSPDDQYYDQIEEIYRKAGWNYNKEVHKNLYKYIETCKNCSECEPIVIMPKDHKTLINEFLRLVENIPISVLGHSYPLLYRLHNTLYSKQKQHRLGKHPKLPGE